MFPKELIVSGKDTKHLPLNIACLTEDIESVKGYLSNETSWNLVRNFKGNILSTDKQHTFIEFLIGYKYDYEFDMFVIKSISQIQENRVLIWFLMNEEESLIPVYCMDTEQIVSNLAKYVNCDLAEICAMREEGLL